MLGTILTASDGDSVRVSYSGVTTEVLNVGSACASLLIQTAKATQVNLHVTLSM